MTLPRDFYGNRTTDETFLLEVGPRAANCYDEAFAIEGRMIRAGLCTWRGARQTEWQVAAREVSRATSTHFARKV